ncbi:hypothetical protein CQW23_06246 [Capsicum baccatum]|uniref:Protein FAR1-RELATED SEQUENCE n=1 Tax=Capsicum baccatum TaxID=33114 RepID=A0A2G2X2Q9_CAPBA|nr:hypothetical protein CQW23_06246 [Capsicum baccatum]
MNKSHQSVQDEDLSVSSGEEDHYGEDDVEEEEGPMHGDSYTKENQRKRVDCKARVNYQVMNDGSCIVTKFILEYNHELEPALLRFLPSHRELSRPVKKSLVAHGIAGLRPSKSIRLLEVEAGGLKIIRFKYEKELESQASKRKHLVRLTIAFDWDMQIYGHYTCAIYNFFRVHVVRLPHCEIKSHVNFDAVEGFKVYNVTDYSIQSDYHGDNFFFTVEYYPSNQYIECNCKTFKSEGIVCCHIIRTMTFKRIHLFHDIYILRRWRRDIVRPHLSKFFPRGYLTMMDEYRVYNGIRKWFNRKYNLVLDCPVRRRDLKNILKFCFKTYMVWVDDMAVPNVLNSNSNIDSIIIRNPREFHSCGRPQINKNRSSRQYVFRGDARRWGSGYYDVYEEGQSSQGRSGDGRRGCRGSRGGGVCGSRRARGDDENISNHPTVHEFLCFSRTLGDVISYRVFLVELVGVLSIIVEDVDRSVRNGQEFLDKLRNPVSQTA